MAGLADFGDMVIQTQCLVEYDTYVTGRGHIDDAFSLDIINRKFVQDHAYFFDSSLNPV